MKKVLIYRNKLLPYSETFIKAQAEALESWEYTYLGKSLCHELPLDASKLLIMPSSKKSGFIKKIIHFFSQIRTKKFIEKLRSLKFDLLHAHFGTDAVNIAYLAEELNIPLVVTLHGFDINIYKEEWESGARGSRRKKYPQQLLALSQQSHVHFIAVSEAIKQRAVAFGIPKEKITVKYIGVDIEKFRQSDRITRNKNILYVGRMVEKKGAKILIQAFAKISSLIPDAKLMMIGDGEDLESNRAYAQSLNVSVDFLGIKSSAEVVSYLNISRIFCLPSITALNGDAEGLAIVLLEAQACGVPVVTSARGGATEGIVHGETGFAFAERDVDQLTAYLILLLQDDELVESMSNAARIFIRERFDLKYCTAVLESYYDTIVR